MLVVPLLNPKFASDRSAKLVRTSGSRRYRFVGAFLVDVKQLEDCPPLTEIDGRRLALVRKLELFLHGRWRLWLPKDMQRTCNDYDWNRPHCRRFLLAGLVQTGVLDTGFFGHFRWARALAPGPTLAC